MPAAAHRSDLFETTPESSALFRFLHRAQQQAVEATRTKIASITFPIASTAPWLVLSVLGRGDKRHFYYDSPQQWALVGIDVAVGCCAAGPERFAQAQAFIQAWRHQFIYAEPIAKAVPAGRFFCSATFFENASSDDFEPVYLFVPQTQVMTMNEASTVTFNCLVTATTDIPATVARLQGQLNALNGAVSLGGAKPASKKTVSKTVDDFERMVTAALLQVRTKQLHKVVLADVMDVAAPQAVDVVRSLQTLRQNHPDCTVFSVGNGRGQSFIGASPERLLSINEGQLTTDALAGSASRGETPDMDTAIGQTLLHSEKERYEHRVVVEFIARQLRSLGLAPHYAAAPKLLQLLHIQHLHTPMGAALDPSRVSPLDVLAKLHPTPAVAGVPRQAACEVISQHETFDRGLYAAPLGWIDTDGNS
ncbi:MAG: isochorismate synthase, partial [Cyanobacteria bacterium J06598_3]